MAKLVLADRQPLLNEALEALLTRDHRHEVLARCTPRQDIPLMVRRLRPDLLLIDANVAMSGQPTLLEHVLAQQPGLKVLLLALETDVPLFLECMGAGAAGVVLKTSGAPTIRTAVESALADEGLAPKPTLPKVLRQLDGRQHAAGDSPLRRLSLREREVLALLGQGWSNESIGKTLFISPHTVRTHIQNILEKLGMHSRLQAATLAMERASELPATQQ
jgi:DNA-binding NarL/FixJ family response regulator